MSVHDLKAKVDALQRQLDDAKDGIYPPMDTHGLDIEDVRRRYVDRLEAKLGSADSALTIAVTNPILQQSSFDADCRSWEERDREADRRGLVGDERLAFMKGGA